MDCITEHILDHLVDAAELIPAEEMAKIAGQAMQYAGVSRPTVEAFLAELGKTNREELLAQAEDF